MKCIPSLCWDAVNRDTAILLWEPPLIRGSRKCHWWLDWELVISDYASSLHHYTRDFSISAIFAAVVVGRALSCSSYSHCGDSLAKLWAAFNNMLTLMASTLDKHLQMNQLLQLGVLNLHCQVELLQDNFSHLWDLAQVNCDPCSPASCLTQYQTHFNSTAALTLQHSSIKYTEFFIPFSLTSAASRHCLH